MEKKTEEKCIEKLYKKRLAIIAGVGPKAAPR